MDLFTERGYERTTAAEIAARVGVTERTFFRYFPDKREVLFDGEAVLRTALTAAIAKAPVALGPLAALFWSFRSIEPLLEGNRPYSKPRHEIIARTPALYERELAKTAALTAALAEALRERGVAELRAALAARIGMAAFVHAVICWLDDPAPTLTERLERTFTEAIALLAEAES
ncbi:TetR family transcriptional regulator [Methylobacterium mesophilicum SR1.6/6]|uniref:TetR family transcriptional regulator n=1 Tax=Methylobacterium mesophilicum SR1.6/6 TaxID=908290 RepID=A0A6B9FKG3_9HYPH|nr:TetR family transcriptional regulator [Methylobacterium mesophilicum]QGY02502.1 TetR family transcriptional regulator [Methylobacterium mesophilicum SR1.6/6]